VGINFMNPKPVINFSMAALEKEPGSPLFTTPLEPYRGLTIADLNRYLPAIQRVEDMKMTRERMHEGLYLADGKEGLAGLPTESIDLIIADPPENPVQGTEQRGGTLTLQQYYYWNKSWLEESYRVLKPTGAIYLLCEWRFSGMYQALLNDFFQVQTRITWRCGRKTKSPKTVTWANALADIWFATKSHEFMFNKKPVGHKIEGKNTTEATDKEGMTNFWADIIDLQAGAIEKMEGDKPEQLIQRILEASSFKLNWVVDPFMRSGGVGILAKKSGRRFIGFEINQDRLLMAMKRIDQA